MAKEAFQRFPDGLCSLLLPCRRRRYKGPRVVVVPRAANHATAPESTSPALAAAPVTIRLATFNAAMFSMAPAVPPPPADNDESRRGLAKSGSGRRRPKKGILKGQSRASTSNNKQQLRVSINLHDDGITSERGTTSNHLARGGAGTWKGKGKAEEGSASARPFPGEWRKKSSSARTRSVAEVLREVSADIVALQNVRAEQDRGMRPLSELAQELGMRYVFAESWAPEYGNAVLSRWPIKRWKVHRIADQSDLRYAHLTRSPDLLHSPHPFLCFLL
ncbi:hypothetical protein PR202_ga25681 [Eleusine coracana subsp. coracana]|uniref:Endonuclease/exonuclease/phosphatase domain-containing protein n=1 Tax=Eleusine coracana subsp. coracana TaxID=191504 RepID=A0AAV5DBD1_ELECO|nr:hypothetical protein PR202_ga25681 [Eleusine coracana subsp. coracana]